MVVFLFALMVIVVLVVELIRYRHGRNAEAMQPAAGAPPMVADVDGFAVPHGLSFHPLHVWAKEEDSQTVRVGLDDLARRLMGRVNRVVLPMTGVELEQGMSSTLLRNGRRVATVVTPVGGEVVEVNRELRDKPNLVFDDNYGKGWLFKIRSWRMAEQLGGLLAGASARDLMSGSANRLKMSLGGQAGEFAQDGGLPLEALDEQLETRDWIRLVREFFGTEAEEQTDKPVGAAGAR